MPVMWKWGARIEQEIGEKEVTEMIGEMVVPEEEDGADDEAGGGEGGEGRREGRERERKREKKRERVRRDVAGAAGLGVGGKLKER